MSVARRAFIQLGAGAAAGILFTPVVWKSLDDSSIWTQNWGWIPTLNYGAVEEKPTVSKLCTSGCAVTVRTVGGQAFGTEGNAADSLSAGGICPICANGVQVMYSPNRVQAPTLKGGKAISWDDAVAMVADKMKGAGSKAAVISGDENGTVNEVFSAVLRSAGSENFYMMPSDMQTASKAWNGLMGGAGQVGYDLESADYVLLAGADALEGWGPTVANTNDMATSKGTFLFAGPIQTRTATLCSKWVPVATEAMAAFTLGVAYHVLQAGKTVDAADFAQFQSMVLSDYTPAKVAAATGLKAETLKAIATGLLKASAPVVVPGCSSVAAHGAAFALNLLLGGGAMTVLPEAVTVVPSAMTRVEMADKEVLKGVNASVLLVNDANPAFALPEAVKADFTIAFALYNNETSAEADLVIPVTHSYEQYADIQSPYGVAKPSYSAGAPVSKTSFDVMSAGDFMLKVAASMGVDLGGENFGEILAAKADALGSDWDSVAEGTPFVADETGELTIAQLGAGVIAKAAVPTKGTGAFTLAPYQLQVVGSAKQATTPNAPAVIPNSQLLGDSLVVMMCSVTAAKIGVADGEAVKLSGGSTECDALVKLFEGVMPGTIAAPLNLGHTVGDEFSKGKGANVYKMLTISSEAAIGAATWVGSTVSVAKI